MMSGRPLLYLTTVGAKSGQPPTAVVMPFPEGDDAWLIVASANGAARHPAWLHNLAAHPDRVEIELEGRKTAVTPQTLSGEERATAWKRITRERPSFAECPAGHAVRVSDLPALRPDVGRHHLTAGPLRTPG